MSNSLQAEASERRRGMREVVKLVRKADYQLNAVMRMAKKKSQKKYPTIEDVYQIIQAMNVAIQVIAEIARLIQAILDVFKYV